VFARAADFQGFAVGLAALSGEWDFERAGKVAPGERFGALSDFGGPAGRYQTTAQATGTGAEVDDVVGALDGFCIEIGRASSMERVLRIV
jgi:hypothetical protein